MLYFLCWWFPASKVGHTIWAQNGCLHSCQNRFAYSKVNILSYNIEFDGMQFFPKDYAFIFPMMYDDIVSIRLIMVKIDIELQLFYM